ncbi:uncharacterized protein BDV14DRAFT_92426 [Aspergillus stella-maris]|uniref:uncharacterized protein n=1 Tax=Aspergillus stella-maris TaxID=1810926 RepID=UPI003CCDF6AD
MEGFPCATGAKMKPGRCRGGSAHLFFLAHPLSAIGPEHHHRRLAGSKRSEYWPCLPPVIDRRQWRRYVLWTMNTRIDQRTTGLAFVPPNATYCPIVTLLISQSSSSRWLLWG